MEFPDRYIGDGVTGSQETVGNHNGKKIRNHSPEPQENQIKTDQELSGNPFTHPILPGLTRQQGEEPSGKQEEAHPQQYRSVPKI
jgi:hypothetical protein